MTFLTVLRPLVSQANSFIGAGNFVGTTEDASAYACITIGVLSDVDGDLVIQQSVDGVTFDRCVKDNAFAGIFECITVDVCAQYYQVSFTANTGAPTSLRLQTILNPYKDKAPDIVNPNLDVAGRTEVSETLTTGDYNFLNNIADTYSAVTTDVDTAKPISTYISGSGATAFVPASNSLSMTVGGATGFAMAQSRSSHPYFAGKAQQVEFTMFNFQPQANAIKRAGYFYYQSGAGVAPDPSTDPIDGMFLESDGSIVRLRIERDGTTVLNVPQESWNGDPLDGTGSSGATIDFSLFNVYLFDFLYLGGALFKFYIFIEGRKLLVHTFAYPNMTPNTFIGSPQVPMAYSVHTDTGAAGTVFNPVCMQVSSMGPQSLLHGYSQSIMTLNSSDITVVDTFVGVIGVRLNPTIDASRTTSVFLRSASIAGSGFAQINWVIIQNPPGTGAANWFDINETGTVQYSLGTGVTPDVSTPIALAPVSAVDGSTTPTAGRITPQQILQSEALTTFSGIATTASMRRRLGISVDNQIYDEYWLCVVKDIGGVTQSRASINLDIFN